jgi:hypothetical protein
MFPLKQSNNTEAQQSAERGGNRSLVVDLILLETTIPDG